MNSSLQCLSHTMPLTLYFKSDDWRDDLNKDNVLGTKGTKNWLFLLTLHMLMSLPPF